MTPISIAKIIVSASVVVAACSAALVFAVTHVQHEERLEAGIVTPTTSPSQPAPVVRSEGSPAVEAMAADAAAMAAELAGPPSTLATDQSVPSFDVARTEETGDAVIAGRAAPGAIVDLLRDGERLDRAVADESGQFVMVPPRLPAGTYELTLNARLPDGTVASSKQGVTVTVNDVGASSGPTQSRTEYVPETASRAVPSPQPPLKAAKPQENAVLQPAQAIATGSTSDEGLSSPAAAPKILTKVVSRGDSLWRISRITYGDGTRYAIVYRANRDRIRDPNLIRPGQILLLPMKRH
jgi:nucleoid-associated protein YgaU